MKDLKHYDNLSVEDLETNIRVACDLIDLGVYPDTKNKISDIGIKGLKSKIELYTKILESRGK